MKSKPKMNQVKMKIVVETWNFLTKETPLIKIYNFKY